jgi:nucleoredoxin
MDKLIENELLKQDHIITTNNVILNKKIIGLYFSGSYCPPCKKFTPILKDIYLKIKEKNNDFEIIFISSDKSENEFKEYYNSMPWLAVPYEKRHIKTKLCNLFGIKTIPRLIILDNDNEVIDLDARKFIEENHNNIDKILEYYDLN